VTGYTILGDATCESLIAVEHGRIELTGFNATGERLAHAERNGGILPAAVRSRGPRAQSRRRRAAR
jgi:hypothetical protein